MTVNIPFQKKFQFTHEVVEQVSPLIRRVVAANPNFFTFHGTNTYIIGHGTVALIDPGPDIPQHIDSILMGTSGETISHIFVTHGHMDHWPAAVTLGEMLDLRICGYDLDRSGQLGDRSASDEEIRHLTNQERFDLTGFIPGIAVNHGEIIQGENWSIECVFTPGHASNHMCYQLREEKVLFSGDHVMGWSTSVISPPSGNMEHYMRSLDLLLYRDDEIYMPAHGPSIADPIRFVRSFIAHRKEREEQIIERVKAGVDTVRDMVPFIYADVPSFLHPAAERSILAAVIYLIKKGLLHCDDQPSTVSPLRLKTIIN